MSPDVSECTFEEAIEAVLVGPAARPTGEGEGKVGEDLRPYGDMAPGGYRRRRTEDYDRALCLLPLDVVDFDSQEWTAERALYRAPVLERARIVRGWAGLYEVSPDHHAIIGEFPELRGFVCANGFSGHGFQHSPATGLLVAELIVDGRATTVDLHPVRPTRFREGDMIHEPLTAVRE